MVGPADAYLAKPFTMDGIVRKVREILSAKGPG
jgi:DNA-binding response OmpR family regulator